MNLTNDHHTYILDYFKADKQQNSLSYNYQDLTKNFNALNSAILLAQRQLAKIKAFLDHITINDIKIPLDIFSIWKMAVLLQTLHSLKKQIKCFNSDHHIQAQVGNNTTFKNNIQQH